MNTPIKIKTYNTMVKPAVVSGGETCAMTEMDKKRLSTWERKM